MLLWKGYECSKTNEEKSKQSSERVRWWNVSVIYMPIDDLDHESERLPTVQPMERRTWAHDDENDSNQPMPREQRLSEAIVKHSRHSMQQDSRQSLDAASGCWSRKASSWWMNVDRKGFDSNRTVLVSSFSRPSSTLANDEDPRIPILAAAAEDASCTSISVPVAVAVVVVRATVVHRRISLMLKRVDSVGHSPSTSWTCPNYDWLRDVDCYWSLVHEPYAMIRHVGYLKSTRRTSLSLFRSKDQSLTFEALLSAKITTILEHVRRFLMQRPIGTLARSRERRSKSDEKENAYRSGLRGTLTKQSLKLNEWRMEFCQRCWFWR